MNNVLLKFKRAALLIGAFFLFVSSAISVQNNIIIDNVYGGDKVEMWHREYKATVDGRLLECAYSGGDELRWPRPTFVDIDNDGDLDLFIGWSDGTIRFYRNQGDKKEPVWFRETDSYAQIDVGSNAAPTFADLDADGDMDLLIGNGRGGCIGGTVTFYLNTGTSTEAQWSLITEQLADIDVCDYSVPTLADIDGDSDLDLFVGGGYGRIEFYRNIGDPTIASGEFVTDNYSEIDVGWKSAPTFTDIDGDGDLDLFIGDDDGDIYFYSNMGSPFDAVWQLETRNFAGVDFQWINYTAPAFADIDSDGDFDLFVGEHDGSLNAYKNTGTFQEPAWNWETGNYLLETIDVGGYSQPEFADIDADGDFDLFIGKQNGQILLYENIGNKLNPQWQLSTEMYNDINLLNRTAIPRFYDIDNDSDLDLIVGVPAVWKARLYLNEGTPSNAVWGEPEGFSINFAGAPTLVDIDADGDLDLFAVNSSGYNTIIYYENVGSATNSIWELRSEMYEGIDVDDISTGIEFSDIDQDGDFDLFFGDDEEGLYYYRNDGTEKSPNFTFVTDQYSSLLVGSWNVPRLVDIDGDNDLDLFLGEGAGGLRHWSNTTKTVLIPNTDIKANGSDGPITITPSDTLSITVELNPGSYDGENADWWLAVNTPFAPPNGWFYYDFSLGWMPELSFTYQGSLFDLGTVTVLNMPGLPEGTYTFYFAVDTNMNGSLDPGELYYDNVVVNITP